MSTFKTFVLPTTMGELRSSSPKLAFVYILLVLLLVRLIPPDDDYPEIVRDPLLHLPKHSLLCTLGFLPMFWLTARATLEPEERPDFWTCLVELLDTWRMFYFALLDVALFAAFLIWPLLSRLSGLGSALIHSHFAKSTTNTVAQAFGIVGNFFRSGQHLVSSIISSAWAPIADVLARRQALTDATRQISHLQQELDKVLAEFSQAKDELQQSKEASALLKKEGSRVKARVSTMLRKMKAPPHPLDTPEEKAFLREQNRRHRQELLSRDKMILKLHNQLSDTQKQPQKASVASKASSVGTQTATSIISDVGVQTVASTISEVGVQTAATTTVAIGVQTDVVAEPVPVPASPAATNQDVGVQTESSPAELREIDSLKIENGGHQQTIQALQLGNAQYQAQNHQLMASNSDAQKVIESLYAERDNLRNQISIIQKAAEDERANLAASQSQSEIQSQLKRAKRERAEREKEVHELKQRLGYLEQMVLGLQGEQNNHNLQLSERDNAIINLNQQLAIYQQQNDFRAAAEQEIRMWQITAQRLQSDCERLGHQLEQNKHNNDSGAQNLRALYERATAEAKAATEEKMKAKARGDEMEAKYMDLNKHYSAHMTSYQKQVNEAQAERDQAKKALADNEKAQRAAVAVRLMKASSASKVPVKNIDKAVEEAQARLKQAMVEREREEAQSEMQVDGPAGGQKRGAEEEMGGGMKRRA